MTWRSIKDDPPPKRLHDYLVYQPEWKSGRQTLSARICFAGQTGVRESTHWMPLPPPPEDADT